MAISKKIRFEVFKRDGFTCAYCGKTPPTVILEIDHIHPRSKGGKDTKDNLLTACEDCNRGKSNIPLSQVPPQLNINTEELQKKEEQIKAYRRYINAIEKRMSKDIEDINQIYVDAFEEWELSEQFKKVSVRRFLEQLPKHEVEHAMHKAISRCPNKSNDAIKYFCGICWNKIKGKGY